MSEKVLPKAMHVESGELEIPESVLDRIRKADLKPLLNSDQLKAAGHHYVIIDGFAAVPASTLFGISVGASHSEGRQIKTYQCAVLPPDRLEEIMCSDTRLRLSDILTNLEEAERLVADGKCKTVKDFLVRSPEETSQNKAA